MTLGELDAAVKRTGCKLSAKWRSKVWIVELEDRRLASVGVAPWTAAGITLEAALAAVLESWERSEGRFVPKDGV